MDNRPNIPEEKNPLMIHDTAYLILDRLDDTADLKNVSLTCSSLRELAKHRLFRFMTLPGAAMGLRNPRHYNIAKGLDHDDAFRKVFGALSTARSLTVSRRVMASAIPLNAPIFLREEWGLERVFDEPMGQYPEIYEAAGILLRQAKELQHLEFHGFNNWRHVMILLHMRETQSGFESIKSIKITPSERPRDVLYFATRGEHHSRLSYNQEWRWY